MSSPTVSIISAFAGLWSIVNLVVIILAVYCLILFIRLGHRGIKALDIYIQKNRRDREF